METKSNAGVSVQKEKEVAQTVQSLQNSIKEQEVAINNTNPTKYKFVIEVAIRRKPGLIGLPGQDPAERNYKIGSSFNSKTRSNLKGVSDVLEQKFLPSVIGVSPTAPEYRKAINEYWGSYSIPVPADEEILPPHHRGVRINIVAHVDKLTEQELKKTLLVKHQMEILNRAIELDKASISDDSVNDYLLLNYCLKYSVVAANVEDIDKSPKILFYIFEKTLAVKQQLSKINSINEAIQLYQTLQHDKNKIDAVLLLFKEDITKLEDDSDKLIKIHELYNQSTANLVKFMDFVKDESWKYKYLISLATEKGKLTNPVNTEVYYYNNVLVGRTLKEAVAFLKGDSEEAVGILKTLELETNFKLNE